MNDQTLKDDGELEDATHEYLSTIHAELFSVATRAERDRMLAAALLVFALVFLGLTGPDLTFGPGKFGLGRSWTLPLGSWIVTAYFTGNFVIAGLLDRRRWFADGAPTAKTFGRLVHPALTLARTEQGAYGLALRELTEKLSSAQTAASAVLAARNRILTELSERAKRGETYDPAELDTDMDEGVQMLEREHRALRSDFDLSNARLATDWPQSRLDRMIFDLPTTADWRRPYRLQFGWYFILPLLVSGAALLMLPLAVVGGWGIKPPGATGSSPRPLVCVATRAEKGKPVATGTLTLDCMAIDPPTPAVR